jgi:SAM-dependent methyltransferase
MRRPPFIARQAARPRGLLGRALGAILALETRALNDEILRRLAIASGERILEIGFGHGRTLERAAKKQPGASFAGIDHAGDMVAALGRRCKALVAAGRLDLRFWRDPGRNLSEMRRVLRRSGRLLLGFRERTPEVKAALPPEIYTLRSRDEVIALLAAAGFEPTASPGPGRGLWVVEARKL